MQTIDHLRALAAVAAHRASASANERKAALWIAQRLRAMGYTATEQTFRATRDNLYLMPAQVFALVLLAACLSLNGHEYVSVIPLLYGLAILLMEVSGHAFDLSVMPRFESRNVYTEGATTTLATVFVTAHFDTQRGTFLFHPRFLPYLQSFFNLCYAGLFITAIGILAAAAGASWAMVKAGLVVVIPALIVFLLAEISGRYTPGGNDNGSGVALALHLAEDYAQRRVEYPSDCELRFVFTGSEETGERGMKAFLRAQRRTLDKKRTFFVNLDNIGTPRLTYLAGEGATFYRRAGQTLLTIARQMDKADERKNLLLPTDALPVSTLGYEAISFLGLGRTGHPGNYHWHTDTVDRVDPDFLHFQEIFFKEYLSRVMRAAVQIQP